jgi:hypothetical protein
MNLKEIVKNYFTVFSAKDLQGLERFFSQSIVLQDWDISAVGIKDVVEANKKIFDSVDSINVSPLNIFLDGNVVIGEIEILINGENRIKVVDIITFDYDSKFVSIRAFKG